MPETLVLSHRRKLTPAALMARRKGGVVLVCLEDLDTAATRHAKVSLLKQAVGPEVRAVLIEWSPALKACHLRALKVAMEQTKAADAGWEGILYVRPALVDDSRLRQENLSPDVTLITVGGCADKDLAQELFVRLFLDNDVLIAMRSTGTAARCVLSSLSWVHCCSSKCDEPVQVVNQSSKTAVITQPTGSITIPAGALKMIPCPYELGYVLEGEKTLSPLRWDEQKEVYFLKDSEPKIQCTAACATNSGQGCMLCKTAEG
jgi:hypothetical protein